MAHERNESVSKQGHILFVCGTILGVCLGFAAGHLSVWSRFSSGDEKDSSIALWESRDWSKLPPLGTDGFSESALLDPRGNLEQPQPFYSPSARRLANSRPVNVTRPYEPTRMASGVSESTSDPAGLAHTQSNASSDEEGSYREHITRSIIEDELPHASPQEWDVWFDVLRGLDPSDVKGILRMKKHVGGHGRTLAGTPGILPDPVAEPPQRVPGSATPPAPASEWSQTIDCLNRIRAIRLHNLCNAQTAGYQRLVPIMSDIGHDDCHAGVKLVRVEHKFMNGEFQTTGRSLDVAIVGDGFLRVRCGERIRLTRRGRLSINDDHHLVLADTSQDWRLDPPIVFPDDAESVAVDGTGVVTVTTGGNSDSQEIGQIELHDVLDPSALRYTGEGLYEETSGSGRAYRLTDESALRQFGIETLPPSVIAAERALLERDAQLIDSLQPRTGTASITDQD